MYTCTPLRLITENPPSVIQVSMLQFSEYSMWDCILNIHKTETLSYFSPLEEVKCVWGKLTLCMLNNCLFTEWTHLYKTLLDSAIIS